MLVLYYKISNGLILSLYFFIVKLNLKNKVIKSNVGC